MPIFRGVEREKILKSFHAACDLVRRMNIGPGTRDIIGQWQQIPELLDGIATAQTNEELAIEIGQSGIFDFCHQFDDLLVYHVLTGGGEAAYNIYRDLAAWGAFEGSKGDQNVKMIDYEINRHIVFGILANWQRLDFTAESPADMRLDVFWRGTARKDQESAKHIKKAADRVFVDFVTGNPRRAKRQFDNFEPALQRQIRDSLMEGAGISMRRALLADLSPLESYRLQISRESDESRAWGEVTAESSSLLAQTLMPYIILSEAYPGERKILPEATRLRAEFNFYATAPAARAVAAAFPDDQVVSRIGYGVAPASGGNSGGPAPS